MNFCYVCITPSLEFEFSFADIGKEYNKGTYIYLLRYMKILFYTKILKTPFIFLQVLRSVLLYICAAKNNW